MAALTTQVAAYPSLALAPVAAAGGGDTCSPGDSMWLYCRNGGGSSINVTVTTFPNTNEWGAALADLVVAVPAGAVRFIGPLRREVHADPVTGIVGLTYSGVTSVEVAAVAI